MGWQTTVVHWQTQEGEKEYPLVVIIFSSKPPNITHLTFKSHQHEASDDITVTSSLRRTTGEESAARFFTAAEKQGRVICDFRSKSGTLSFGDKLNTELIRSRPGADEKKRPLDVVAKSRNTCHLSAYALRMTIIKGVACGGAQNGGRG